MSQAAETSKVNTDAPLSVTVVLERRNQPNEMTCEKLKAMLRPYDELLLVDQSDFMKKGLSGDTDIIVCTNLCGYHTGTLGQIIAEMQIPVFALETHCYYHTYHAAFYKQVKEHNGILLPAFTPEEIASSIAAVRSRKALKGMKLVQVSETPSTGFAEKLRKQTGIEVITGTSEELRQIAATFDNTAADRELERWHDDIISGTEMDRDHMRQVAKLYLAERSILKTTGAVGITVNDIKDFLLQKPERLIMPNASYGILAHDGYLACEEGDIEVLTSELILKAATGCHATMSNIYYYYRDRFSRNRKGHRDYTDEMMQADAKQCFEDNCITLSHFGAFGVIPPDLAAPGRPCIRNCPIPGWTEQSMIYTIPECNRVVMGRISHDADKMHIVYGKTDSIISDDCYVWERGRWIIKLPDAREFAENCLHQHYAVGKDTGNRQVLSTMLNLLNIEKL